MILKTYPSYEQATSVCACECMITMATTEEGCPVEGGTRIREGQIRAHSDYDNSVKP